MNAVATRVFRCFLGFSPPALLRFAAGIRFRGFPEITAIELTNRCPCRCMMCPRTYAMKRPQGVMEPVLFRRLIDEIAAAGRQRRPVWLHMFGESLFHPDLVELVRYATGKGVPTGLSLNPYFLTEDKARGLVEAGISALMLSLDGVDDASLEQIRGLPNAWGRSVAHLHALARIVISAKSKVHVTLSMIDLPGSEDRKDAYLRQFSGLPFRIIHKRFTNWGGGVAEIGRLAAVTPPVSGPVTCLKPWYTVSINAQGTVLPCCLDYDGVLVLGNTAHQGIRDIWQGSAFLRSMRHAFASNDLTSMPFCRNCNELRASPRDLLDVHVLSEGAR